MLASITTSFLTKMVGLKSSSQIWDTFNTYFESNTRAQIKIFFCDSELQKNDRAISAYLLEIKKSVDSLAIIGAPISIEDHIEAILDGLSKDFDPFVSSIMSRKEPYQSMRSRLLYSFKKNIFNIRSIDMLPYTPAA